jgi:hypothetical protein
MKNIDKEFVPYQEALELNELGFDEPSLGWYTSDGSLIKEYITNKVNKFTLAPTFSQAFRWFREKYDIASFVKREYSCTIIIGFYFGIDTPNNFDFIDFYSKNYKTYEEAELECLKKLIEIVKNK